MSETDSFIDEVTEEVRRDRLYRVFKRWGWVGVLAVLAIVGGAAWNEYQTQQRDAAAQSFGDGVMAAMKAEDPLAALKDVPAEGARAGVLDLVAGATALEDGKTDQAVTHFQAAADNQALPPSLHDLARLKLILAQGAQMPASERDAMLADLAKPGAPYSELAQEQQILVLVADGKTDEAISQAQSMLQEADLTSGVQQRLTQLIVALGGEMKQG
ncbi:tetratricopeptide repeat protein [Thioclava sp. GXIMD4216]|uniref:Tetratricopeptide repeat protein n=1 Tax=Thioclava litoralis TaxID=3076557 RepID=A0ABZ1DXK1_9RHOB|nr:tetratricopeptide repeat protein [Thioclava sp. FTW29]